MENRLLKALSSTAYGRLQDRLEDVFLTSRQVLHRHGEALTAVYFPSGSVCSTTAAMEDGATVDVATIGSEGVVGISAFFGTATAMGHATVRVSGPAQRLSIEAFRQEMAQGDSFADVVNRYAQMFVGVLAQSVACNSLHSAEERCCRWLLTIHDQVGRQEFAFTQEMLASMLGVRRSTVSITMTGLERAGFLVHSRGRIHVTNPLGLETGSCECYRAVNHLSRLLFPSRT